MIDLERPYETLLLESPAAGVVQVTLNRPDRYNAMTVTMFDELESLAHEFADDRDTRVMILTGAGKAFCAGYDLDHAEKLEANMEVASFASALELENRGQALLTRCDDMTEALEAFKAKRAPSLSGRRA